jgi:hypothetical protein
LQKQGDSDFLQFFVLELRLRRNSQAWRVFELSAKVKGSAREKCFSGAECNKVVRVARARCLLNTFSISTFNLVICLLSPDFCIQLAF